MERAHTLKRVVAILRAPWAVLVGVLAVVMGIVVLQASDHPALSPVDELQHLDYVLKAPSAFRLLGAAWLAAGLALVWYALGLVGGGGGVWLKPTNVSAIGVLVVYLAFRAWQMRDRSVEWGQPGRAELGGPFSDGAVLGSEGGVL